MTSPSDRIKDLRGIEEEVRVAIQQSGGHMDKELLQRYRIVLHNAKIERLSLQLLLAKQGYSISINKSEPKVEQGGLFKADTLEKNMDELQKAKVKAVIDDIKTNHPEFDGQSRFKSFKSDSKRKR